MTDSRDRAQSLFLSALEIADDRERAVYLETQCGTDSKLLREVEELLEHAQRLGRFMEADEGTADARLDQPIAEQTGAQIGPYKLLQKLGEGGMGVVYMAEQKEPVKRRVALKIIKPGMDTRQVIARFEAERQALALMDHPNIAKVLDAGATDSDRTYFVMELVKGVPLTKYCDEQHLTPNERLQLFIPICQAVQHAHQKGIIHRDIKPSNVLVALYDGQPVPKVIDFGVAKATSQQLTEKTMFTQYGQILGTLDYMSPEQAELNQLDVDTRSDIYSLGVLLYELLTGATPFDRERLRSAAFDEMLRIIREEEPPRPSMRLSTIDTLPSVAASRRTEPQKLRTLVRGELDWIVMKALEKDRARRYETANGFAADVQRYLDDEPVVACPPSKSYRLRKFARRHKSLLLTATAFAAVLIAATAISSRLAIRARIAEGIANDVADANALLVKSESGARRDAEDKTLQLEQQLRVSTAREFSAQSRAVRDFSPVQSLLLAVEAVNSTRLYGEPIVPIAHETLLTAVTTVGGQPFVGHQDRAHKTVLSLDGRWLVTGSRDKTARLWNLDADDPTRSSLILRGHDNAVQVAISPNSRRLVTWGLFDERIRVWDLTAKDPSKASLLLGSRQGHIGSVAISKDSRWLVAATARRGDVQLWDLSADDPSSSLMLRGEPQVGGDIAISPDGRWLIRDCYTTVQRWDLSIDDYAPLDRWDENEVGASRELRRSQQIAISPNSRWLATAGYGDKALLWDLSGNTEDFSPFVLPHKSPLSVVYITADSRWLVTADRLTVQLWDLNSGSPSELPISLEGHERIPGPYDDLVTIVTASCDGRWLATGGSDATARLWDLHADDPAASPTVLRGHQGSVRTVVLSPDGRWLVTGSSDHTAKIWDRTASDPRSTSVVLRGHEGPVRSAAVTSNSRWLITQADDTMPRLWDLKATNPASPLELRVPGRVHSVAISPDSRWCITGSSQNAQVWNISNTDPASSPTVQLPFGHSDYLGPLIAMDRRSRWLAIVQSQDMTVHLWDVGKAEEPFTTSTTFQHDYPVEAVAISPDGQWLITGGGRRLPNQPENQRDGKARLWDLEADDPASSAVVLRDHAGVARTRHAVAVSPDCRWVVTVGDRTARLWDLNVDALIDRARRSAGRELTPDESRQFLPAGN